MEFGVIVPQGWKMDLVDIADPVEAYEAMTRVAQEAEKLNFDSVWLYDHFHTVPTPTQEVTFECWTSMAALARDTKRVRLGQIVTCNSYRNPALLAKMASTVDVISHGRLVLGIGAGWYEHEYNAYDYPYPSGPDRLRMLREALQIIHAMWSQEEAHFEGKYYQVRGAINQPKGVQKPHIPILVGGGGEKVTLKLVAQYADACNVGGTIENIKHKLEVLKGHCNALGRDYDSIKRTAIVDDCAIARTDEEAVAKLPANMRANIDEARKRALIGTPDMIRERIAEYEAAGIQELIIRFSDATKIEPLHLFVGTCMH
ncbi:LLM class F420-dependent oxidoreductase [Ktedonobacter robiniae]|uniref:LLM class F420-dependent oxidoreductase n=1 Tax=Ktedonobacter robiniae TaxID=2778365 RepID=A0ABQ3V1P5_9CHLR|nr:LLM class F420-dependent oxidoreductase [Ktedonobacter robiniae]GHO59074.1 LLM class F420-dependent oxidoreductase [Ktedonobacter robiniae]